MTRLPSFAAVTRNTPSSRPSPGTVIGNWDAGCGIAVAVAVGWAVGVSVGASVAVAVAGTGVKVGRGVAVGAAVGTRVGVGVARARDTANAVTASCTRRCITTSPPGAARQQVAVSAQPKTLSVGVGFDETFERRFEVVAPGGG